MRTHGHARRVVRVRVRVEELVNVRRAGKAPGRVVCEPHEDDEVAHHRAAARRQRSRNGNRNRDCRRRRLVGVEPAAPSGLRAGVHLAQVGVVVVVAQVRRRVDCLRGRHYFAGVGHGGVHVRGAPGRVLHLGAVFVVVGVVVDAQDRGVVRRVDFEARARRPDQLHLNRAPAVAQHHVVRLGRRKVGAREARLPRRQQDRAHVPGPGLHGRRWRAHGRDGPSWNSQGGPPHTVKFTLRGLPTACEARRSLNGRKIARQVQRRRRDAFTVAPTIW